MEILLCFAILSVSLYPIAFLFQHAGIDEKSSDGEMLATMLAHHATETLIAMRAKDASYIPQSAKNAPVAMRTDSPNVPHEYFKSINADGTCITNLNNPKLFELIKDYAFTIDTYLRDTRFYKTICKINYSQNGSNKQVFFERQLYGISQEFDDESDADYDEALIGDDAFSFDDGNLSDE